LGPKKRKFVKPIYEISIESQNQVYIREEDKGPLRTFLNILLKFALFPIAALILATLFFQIVQNTFSPPELFISVQHITSGESLSPAELASLNIYLDDSSRPMPKKVRSDGISIKFRKKGEHILGIENLASPVDSALFHKEKSYIKNIHLVKSLRKGTLRDDKQTFSFHKIISAQELSKIKILFYSIPAPQSPKAHLFFSAYSKSPQLLLYSPFAKEQLAAEMSLDDVAGYSLEKLASFSRYTRLVDATDLKDLETEYMVSAPKFAPYSWYSDLFKNERYNFAQKIVTATRSTIFLMPHVYQKDKKNLADFVLAFAPLNGVDFQPIHVRECNADPADDLFLHITEETSLLDIIEKYLLIYEDFIITGLVHDNLVQQFADFCNGLSPQVDALSYFDNRVLRNTNGKPAEETKVNLEDFLAEIEPLTCMSLYDRLMTFWTTDAESIEDNELNLRNREILRAIIRRSLALRAEKHMCSEQNWPSVSQQRLLFQAMQNNIAQRWTWEWLSSEPWLDMVKSEIDSLTKK
jgi:hypothetical protein